ncbi:hypothetical protein GCM10010123_36150 [Pilimelia anulata]|uniref:Prepilin-type N-terminal cleavage/methylation domain-containing protein n=1 Tax=Pilimelia anulata TaxID=53371 RepID=A0A8J3FD50_9ACTN|nr:prepilin-type N-terminal cleavage/methylation domain-containing protein [Pilimelia anulata]GGK02963.1 hypothetical protein GCM10010123_36150 [Pilimelia anulata]
MSTDGGSGTDSGFTLVELLVSLVVIGLVMSAVTSFFVVTLGTTHDQADRQAASQAATSAFDYAQRKGAAAVETWIQGNDEPGDTAATAPDRCAAPAEPQTCQYVDLGGVRYSRAWDIDRCHLPNPVPTTAPSPAACLDGPGDADDAALLRVTVRVTWPCRTGTCVLEDATLLSAARVEPGFRS